MGNPVARKTVASDVEVIVGIGSDNNGGYLERWTDPVTGDFKGGRKSDGTMVDATGQALGSGTYVPQTQTIPTTGTGNPQTIFQVQSAAAGRAPFVVAMGNGVFNGTYDPILSWSYNSDPVGNAIVSTEPMAEMKIEAFYDQTPVSPNHVLEFYIELNHPAHAGTDVRPWQFQMNRDTGAYNMSQVMVGQSGFLFLNPDQTGVLSVLPQQLIMPGKASTQTIFKMQAGTSGGSEIDFGFGGTDKVLSIATVAVNQYQMQGLSGQGLCFIFTNQNGGGPAWYFGGHSAEGTATVVADAYTTSTPALRAKQAGSSQAAASSLVQGTKSDGTILSHINGQGHIATRMNVIPADADLVAGELAFWYDSTNGASKLMVKAKQADGTVKTASVALA